MVQWCRSSGKRLCVSVERGSVGYRSGAGPGWGCVLYTQLSAAPTSAVLRKVGGDDVVPSHTWVGERLHVSLQVDGWCPALRCSSLLFHGNGPCSLLACRGAEVASPHRFSPAAKP